MVVGIGVGLAMVAVIVVSNLLGVLFPVLLTKLSIDPAVASSSMVTSTTDVTSLFLYFSIVRLVIDRLQGVSMYWSLRRRAKNKNTLWPLSVWPWTFLRKGSEFV